MSRKKQKFSAKEISDKLQKLDDLVVDDYIEKQQKMEKQMLLIVNMLKRE